MSIPSLLAVPAALVMVLASTASAAQEKPASTTSGKPVTTLTKPVKNVSKPSALTDVTAKTAAPTPGKARTPSDAHSVPMSERAYEGCQGKDDDA